MTRDAFIKAFNETSSRVFSDLWRVEGTKNTIALGHFSLNGNAYTTTLLYEPTKHLFTKANLSDFLYWVDRDRAEERYIYDGIPVLHIDSEILHVGEDTNCSHCEVRAGSVVAQPVFYVRLYWLNNAKEITWNGRKVCKKHLESLLKDPPAFCSFDRLVKIEIRPAVCDVTTTYPADDPHTGHVGFMFDSWYTNKSGEKIKV